MLLVIDANVLIDYANSDISILGLIAHHIGAIFVPSVILNEVDNVGERECENLGIIVVEESTEILLAAGKTRGGLSFEDHVCLLLAAENGWTCVSNDKPLHKACKAEKIPVVWGLRLMIELIRKGELEKSAALEIAKDIQKSNPRHITQEIVDKFKKKIESL